MSVFLDTYSISTMGYNTSPLGLVLFGYYTVEIIELEDDLILDTGGVYNPYVSSPDDNQLNSPKNKKRYKIKVTAIIKNEKIIEEKIVKSFKKPTIHNVSIKIDEDNLPKIKINLIE